MCARRYSFGFLNCLTPVTHCQMESDSESSSSTHPTLAVNILDPLQYALFASDFDSSLKLTPFEGVMIRTKGWMTDQGCLQELLMHQ
jgi:hypothetical protein